jgi:hypothetical protein
VCPKAKYDFLRYFRPISCRIVPPESSREELEQFCAIMMFRFDRGPCGRPVTSGGYNAGHLQGKGQEIRTYH